MQGMEVAIAPGAVSTGSHDTKTAMSTPASAVALPQELLEAIIDALADSGDRDALRAVALTARRCVHRARHHLHGTFTLRHRNLRVHPAFTTQRVGVHSEGPSPVLCAEERAKARIPPAVLAYARELHIRGEPSNMCFHNSSSSLYHAEEDSENDADAFWGVLSALGKVATVRVSELYCADVPANDVRRLCGALARAGVRHLALEDCEFRDPGEMGRVLAACGGLRTLKLGWIFWAHGGALGPANAVSTVAEWTGMRREGAFAQLDALEVGYCARKMDERIVGIFAAAGDALAVRRLALGPTELDVEMLPAWVRVVGTSLEQLTLSFGQVACADVARKVSHCLTSENCPNLRTLILSAKPWSTTLPSSRTHPHFWPCALEFVRVAASVAAFETVEFVWSVGEDEQVDEMPEQIREVLAGSGRRMSNEPLKIVFTTRSPDGMRKRSICHKL